MTHPDLKRRKHEEAFSWFMRPDIVEFYAEFEERNLAPFRLAFIELAFALHRQDDPLRILDIGCGTGSGLEYIRRRAPDAPLVGIDPNSRLIAEAGRRLGSDTQLVESGIEDLANQHQLGTFDIILSYSNFRLWMNPRRGLQTVRSLLAKNGLAYLLDLRRDAAPELLSTVAQRLQDTEHRRYYLDQVAASYTAMEARHLLADAGVADYDVRVGGLGGMPARSKEAFRLLQTNEQLAKAVFALHDSPMSTSSSSELAMHIYIRGA